MFYRQTWSVSQCIVLFEWEDWIYNVKCFFSTERFWLSSFVFVSSNEKQQVMAILLYLSFILFWLSIYLLLLLLFLLLLMLLALALVVLELYWCCRYLCWYTYVFRATIPNVIKTNERRTLEVYWKQNLRRSEIMRNNEPLMPYYIKV